jgi:hypothetical protein
MNARNGQVGAGWVPAIVDAGLGRCQRERTRLGAQRPTSDEALTVRAERMAVLFEREARWWTVLDRWTYLGQDEIPNVYGRAALIAAGESRRDARFYRDLACDFRRRVAGQPMCPVIGCGCGGVCGVSA